MLYSLKKETWHERPKDKTQIKKKKKIRDNTHPLSPHPHPDMKTRPHPPPNNFVQNKFDYLKFHCQK